jgi:hypothetical protein
MALQDRLLTSLRVSLTGATDALLSAKLWEVVNEACRDGWIWRETITIPLTDGIQVYDDLHPAGAEIVAALSIDHETLDLTGSVYEWGILTLGVEPTAGDAATDLYMVAVLTPDLESGEDPESLLPVDMWSTHYELLRRGVLAAMMAEPAKPWTNGQLATFYERSFRSRLMEARHHVETGGIRGGQLWAFPRWA